MNKKFSTLMTTGLLLSGALFCNVNAKTVTFSTDSIKSNKILACAAGDTILIDSAVNLSEDTTTQKTTGNDGKKYFIIAQPNVTLLGKGANAKLTGRIIVVAEGVTIKNLPIKTITVNEDANGYWTKTALTAFADALTVDSCSFTASNPASGTIPNGIVIYPQSGNVAYSLDGNTFTDLNTTVGENPTWYSSAIQVYKKTQVEDKTNDPVKMLIAAKIIEAPAGYGTVSAIPAINGAEIIAANTFEDCAADLIVRNGNELDSGYSVEYAHVTKKAIVSKAALEGDMVAALVDAIQNSKEGTVIEVAGATAEDVAAILTDTNKVSKEVARTFVGKNVVISTADDRALVLGTVDNAPEGAINVVVKADGSAAAYVAKVAPANVGSGNYLLMTPDGKALQAQTNGTARKETYTATDPELFIWNLQYDAASNSIRFYNAETEKYLIDDANPGVLVTIAATDKKINPVITFGSNVASGTAAALGVYTAPVNALKAGDLRSIFGASFYAAIEFATSDKDADKTLANNPFDGNLTPKAWSDSTGFYNGEVTNAAANATSFLLQKENGKLIVMQTTEMYATTTGAKKYAYRIVEVDAKTVAASLKKGEKTYVPYFSFNAPYNYVIGSGNPVSNITVTDGTTVYQLGSISLSDVNTLAAAEQLKDFLDAITVELSKYNRLDAKDLMTGKFYTVTNKNTKDKYSKNNYSKVLGLNENGNAAFMKTSEVLVGYPETQWAVTSVDGQNLKFTNRENPNGGTFNVTASDLYKTGEDNVYAFVISSHNALLGAKDTIEIKAVATAPSDGYKRFDADKLKDQSFYLGSHSAVRGTAFVTENHKDNHQVGLEKEQENATAWRMAPLMFQKEDAWGNAIKGAITPDTICIVSKVGVIKDKAITTKDDTLKIVVYSFKNIENNEFMAYDYGRNRYTTGNENQKTGYRYGNHFALKIMGGDSTKYNLVVTPIYEGLEYSEEGYYINNDNKPYTRTVFSEKVYAGETSAKGILNKYNMYQQNESDLFTIAEEDAPEYLKLKQGDVIKIYREEYDSESNVLFEKGEFLGVGNAVENTKINPALYVDTVYVDREGNNRWEYLLGLNITRIDTTYKCDEPSHAHLTHKADTTKGRFLVNFADSAIVENGKTDIHVNKYIVESGGWNDYDAAKLGFVKGFRTNDTLYISNGNTKKIEKIEVGTAAPQLVKFAFRIVDPNTESFVIETGYKAPYEGEEIDGRGYLRFINGNIVVTSQLRDAEVFKLKDDNRKPVANEDINASAISVATTNGAVIVKGAQGKKVVISNVLGQTIANTVITSSEATFAAPAGYVTVAVEGESAVKAIVK